MPTYTRTQILAKIANDITTNGTESITGAILKGVLDYMVSEQITPTQIEIPVTDEIDTLEGITDLNNALIAISQRNVPAWVSGMVAKAGSLVRSNGLLYYLKANVDSGDTTAPATDTTNYQLLYTGAQIVGLLEALTGEDMLDSDFVQTSAGATRQSLQDTLDYIIGLAESAVPNTGNTNVAGVKTFASSPIVPTPTTDMQTATKKYVDDNVNTGSQVTVAALDIDWSLGRHFIKSVNTSPTFTFSNLVDCKEIKLELNLTGEGLSVAWPAYCKVMGAVADGYNLVTLYCSNATGTRVYVRIENQSA